MISNKDDDVFDVLPARSVRRFSPAGQIETRLIETNSTVPELSAGMAPDTVKTRWNTVETQEARVDAEIDAGAQWSYCVDDSPPICRRFAISILRMPDNGVQFECFSIPWSDQPAKIIVPLDSGLITDVMFGDPTATDLINSLACPVFHMGVRIYPNRVTIHFQTPEGILIRGDRVEIEKLNHKRDTRPDEKHIQGLMGRFRDRAIRLARASTEEMLVEQQLEKAVDLFNERLLGDVPPPPAQRMMMNYFLLLPSRSREEPHNIGGKSRREAFRRVYGREPQHLAELFWPPLLNRHQAVSPLRSVNGDIARQRPRHGPRGKDTQERRLVDAFLDQVSECGTVVSRNDIRLVAGYSDDSLLVRFQSGTLAENSATAEIFNRVLRMTPDDFLRELRRRRPT